MNLTGKQEHCIPENPGHGGGYIHGAGIDRHRQNQPVHPTHASPGGKRAEEKRNAIIASQAGLPDRFELGIQDDEFMIVHTRNCMNLDGNTHAQIDEQIAKRYNDPTFPQRCRNFVARHRETSAGNVYDDDSENTSSSDPGLF